MHSRHGVSVLRTLFEPTLLELQRGPIELVDQLGMPLPQPFLGQELSGQTLEPRDDPAVVGIHAATPLLPSPRPRGVWLMRGTRADGQRPATALRRPAIQYSGGIALHLPRPNTPRPNTWPLNSQRLGRFRPYCPSDPLRPTVWRVYHIPPDKLLACFGNFRRHSSARRAMARVILPTDVERTACDRPAAARGCPRYPLSSASSPSAIAHARNARAAPRALASPEISSRRRTRRSRRYGNRGLTYVRANPAASSRVRRVTSCARRRGGSNTKSGMPRKLARHNPVPVPSYIMSDTLSLRWTTARRVQAPAVRISRGVFPVQRLNACVNALTS